MASLLGGCNDTYRLYNEIDHLVQFAFQAWGERGGGKGTRDPHVQPRSIRVTVGLEPGQEIITSGPERCGGAATPPGARTTGTRLPGSPAPWRSSFSSTCESLNSARATAPPRRSRGKPHDEEFTLPDFILMDCPTLAEMHWSNGGRDQLGPVRRSPTLFSTVVTLLKLRWLVRLHYALVSFAGQQCSLQRLLAGVLADTCGVHAHPHPPVQLYELLVETLKSRFTQRWPLFVAYVATFDHGRGPGGTAPHTPSVSRPQSREAGIPDLWQLVDEIFVAYLVQLDPHTHPTTQVLQELTFFGVTPPVVPGQLEGLRAWQAARDLPGSQPRYARQAQRDAHSFAVLLEVPSLRRRWDLVSEEVLELARTVATHPKTFNAGVCARVMWVLKGGRPVSGETDHSMAESLAEEQLAELLSYSAGPHDRGRIEPRKLDMLRDMSASIKVGRASRYQNASPRLDPI